MSAGAQAQRWNGPSRRRVPRFQIQAPLDVTVLRSGIPDTVPGRSVNVCERGISAVLAGELVLGETVGIEVRLSQARTPLRTRAFVRYQENLRCGLEFVGLSAEQRTAIRDWAKAAKAETEIGESPNRSLATTGTDLGAVQGKISGGGPSRKPSRKRRGMLRTVLFGLFVLAAVSAAVFWWRWRRGWEELEAGLKTPQMALAEKPQAHVSAEVMQKLLVHKVEPAYPAEARMGNQQGIIALDIVIGRDGSVVSMHALNGPDVLAQAAMDALRWWKFEPYRLNGEPAVVETTVAVEFKR